MKIFKINFWFFLMIFILLLIFYSLLLSKSLIKNHKFSIATITSDFHYKSTWKPAGYDYNYNILNKKFLPLLVEILL